MSRARILYLDVPFENESGGDKNRSRFLFQALRESFDVDVLLVGHEGASTKPAWTNFKPLAIFAPQPAPWPRPASAPSFAPADRERFTSFLRENKYAAVFCRFTIGWNLIKLILNTAPEAAVVVDVDMVSSRLVALTWAANPSFKKRWFLFEKWKLQRFERQMFREAWLFLFTNYTELTDVRDGVAPQPATGEFSLLPNTMPRPFEPAVERQPVVLFFGSLDSSANVDGFQFLVDEVLPQIEADLKRHNVKIHIAGKNPPAAFAERLRAIGTDRVKLIGPVDSIERAIAESQFVLLPLRIASGTRTRILEAAAVGCAVVTTTIGAEGLDLGDTVSIGDTAQDLAAHVRRLLADKILADESGSRLRERSTALYAAGNVAADLVAKLNKYLERKQGGVR
ncbi:MAG: glycosyltransferase family 4 protein [Verrucomicrobiota bacterium]